MPYSASEPRDNRGRWTDGGGSGVAVASPHEQTGHNSQWSGVAREFVMGAVRSAPISALYGGAIGGVLGGGPVGAVTGAASGFVGGAVAGSFSAAIQRHAQNVENARRDARATGQENPHPFWTGRGGAAARVGLLTATGVASAFSSFKANQAAGEQFRKFYGGSDGGAFRDSSSSFSDRQGGPQYKSFSERMRDFNERKEKAQKAGIASEKVRMAERAAEKARSDPTQRKADALRAMANDRWIGPAERAAFQAKANEFLRKHRAGPTTGRSVSTKH